MAASLIPVGIFGAAHGVRGEVRLKSYTTDPASIGTFGPLWDGAGGRSFDLVSVRVLKDDMLVARVRGIDERNAAEALTSITLHVARDRLPPAAEDEFYHVDLFGLRVETVGGLSLGHVVSVQNFGAGDLIEVGAAEGETLMLPFTKAVVPVVDIAGGRIEVVPPSVDEAESAEPSSAEPTGQ